MHSDVCVYIYILYMLLNDSISTDCFLNCFISFTICNRHLSMQVDKISPADRKTYRLSQK